MIVLVLAIPPLASAAPPISIDVSNDIDWNSGIGRITDETVLEITLPASSAMVDLGPLPLAADITAYHRHNSTFRFFSVDVPVDLSQGLIFPQNVIAWDGQTYFLAIDPALAAIPGNAGIDAISSLSAGESDAILLSFDVTLQLPGGLIAADEDIVAWNGSSWSMYFDGSVQGLPANLDVDGFDRDPATSTLYFSFDTSGQLGAVFFADEDVIAFDGQTWSMALDVSNTLDPAFAAGDLDAFSLRTGVLFRDGFESFPPPN